jgi:hypothetical protein
MRGGRAEDCEDIRLDRQGLGLVPVQRMQKSLDVYFKLVGVIHGAGDRAAPAGATALGEELVDRALGEAGKYKLCPARAHREMRIFLQLFTAKIDRTISMDAMCAAIT